MRKLRRLPWRIPKSHNHQSQPASAAQGVEISPRSEPERESARSEARESYRDMLNSQPVAFAGGRYVYGAGVASAAVPCSTEIRRKARHRITLGPSFNPQRA
jgi:hypothetical protein